LSLQELRIYFIGEFTRVEEEGVGLVRALIVGFDAGYGMSVDPDGGSPSVFTQCPCGVSVPALQPIRRHNAFSLDNDKDMFMKYAKSFIFTECSLG
jgi:hypothetical protein